MTYLSHDSLAKKAKLVTSLPITREDRRFDSLLRLAFSFFVLLCSCQTYLRPIVALESEKGEETAQKGLLRLWSRATVYNFYNYNQYIVCSFTPS